ncbi:hypothetical protein HMPREF9446_03779 [Bacteroides fluxus YIT 12057]|uniref:Uncharacterized protein n=1 Tax=Bacteroides fluxus YIT 12057 TaxID=763034 RepID=F3PYD1_9BACE|nr:hypothetical protein HMPREF9446_03779 [Bacteroides fluxus YIT 12057]
MGESAVFVFHKQLSFMKKQALFLMLCTFIAVFGLSNSLSACTSAVISGKVTPDGRTVYQDLLQ